MFGKYFCIFKERVLKEKFTFNHRMNYQYVDMEKDSETLWILIKKVITRLVNNTNKNNPKSGEQEYFIFIKIIWKF